LLAGRWTCFIKLQDQQLDLRRNFFFILQALHLPALTHQLACPACCLPMVSNQRLLGLPSPHPTSMTCSALQLQSHTQHDVVW
jgi:hypothetical protein